MGWRNGSDGALLAHPARRLSQKIPQHAGGHHRQRDTQEKDQGILAPPPRPADRVCIRQHFINAHGIGDVLDLAVPERLVTAHDLVLDLLVDRAGDKDLSWLGDALDTRGDIDAVAVDVVRLHYDVTEIDANPVLDPGVLRSEALRPMRFCWMTMLHRTASTGLSKIAMKPSPVVFTRLPLCST